MIPAGATLSTGQAAPACRLSFPLYGNAPTAFTAEGCRMFDAAARWAAGDCGAAPTAASPNRRWSM